jgi:inner membrane protein
MDSVTQFALGAALGQASMGGRVGWRAAVAGGIIATLPDLDVLVPFADAVERFTYHRSASHSLIVLTLVAPIVAWLTARVFKSREAPYTGWLLLAWLCLFTHPLLDAATVYGTQLLWPLTEYPFGTASVFIIDPAYTVPLLIGLGFALWGKSSSPRGSRVNLAMLGLSTSYLLFTLVLQGSATEAIRDYAKQAGLPDGKLLVSPTPFNTVLWRGLIVAPDAYYVTYHSLYAPSAEPHFERYNNNVALLAPFQKSWAVNRLVWFTKGFNAVAEGDDKVTITDLRMGLEPSSYVFSFMVAKRDGAGVMRPVDVTRRVQSPQFGSKRLGQLWESLTTGRPPPRAQ